MPRTKDLRLRLNGLEGSNMLGFLAAVGTLRTATLAKPHWDWRMKWVSLGGVWTPELAGNHDLAPTELIEVLVSALDRPTPEFDFDKNLAIGPERFREVARDAQLRASPPERGYADFMAAFGCDVLVTDDGRTIQDTALRTMGGAGHQHFIGTMQHLVHQTSAEDLRRSLFEPWTYSDRKLGLRWDPQEDRRYALRWNNPTVGDGVPTMHGANRLAVEALPLLATAPIGRRLETTGFVRTGRTTRFSWPIWDRALGMDVVRSTLSMSEVQSPEPDRSALQAIGIVDVYRNQRLTVGKYRNFTIAQPA